jgi:predicted nucleic acid-binding protein
VNFRPVYLDASAIVKLIVPEAETAALMAALAEWPDRVSSVVARVEVHRALRRAGASPAQRARAEAVLSGLVLIRIDEPILSAAAALRDPRLRALDAIHLATALSLGDDPETFIVYDAKLAHAATKQRLRVAHPGVGRLS